MARFFWDEGASFQEFTGTWEYSGIDTFLSLASFPAETGMEANFNASPSSVIAGPNSLSYNLESGYQPAGEGFEYQVEGGDTYYYQPALKGVTRTWGDVTDGWAIIPCVIRLTMDTFELVDVIELVPSIPTITNYRDASRFYGSAHFPYGLMFLPDFIPWGRIGDCVAGTVSVGSTHTGELHTILRVGDWLIPQISNSNQMYAYNLADESYFRLEGWDDLPAQLLQANPQDGIDFEAYAHTRSRFNVIGSAGDDKVLVLVETQDRECSVVSDFINTKTPEVTLYGETMRDTFRAKWVNSSGTTSLEYSGDTGYWYDTFGYNWDLPDLACGGVWGGPWESAGFGPPHPPWVESTVDARSYAEIVAEQIAAMTIDLDALAATPRLIGPSTTAVYVELQVWEFPVSGSPAYLSTLYTWDDTTVEGTSILMGPTEYTFTETTLGALPVEGPSDAYPDNYVIDWFSDSNYHREPSSDFSFGSGVLLHSFGYLEVDAGERWISSSEDVNNCPGPSGPWLDVGEVDGGSTLPVLLTTLETPIVANPLLPAAPEWNPCHVVNDGSVAILLPHMSKYGLIKCVPLIEPGSGDPPLPAWEINSRDYVDENISESIGACLSNGVLTAQFLYLVLANVGRQTLLKIRVYDALDEEELVTEAAGTVVEMVDLTDFLGGYESYRDTLVVVNRRLVGINNTEFFEITGTPIVPGSGSGS